MFLSKTRKALLHFTQNPTILQNPIVYFSTSIQTKREENPIVAANPSPVYALLTQNHQFSPQVASHVASSINQIKNPKHLDTVLSFLNQNGLSKTQLEQLVKDCPKILVSSVDNHIKPKFDFLKEFGFSHSEIPKIVSKDPWILRYSLSDRIAPGLSVLKGLLGSNEQVAKLLMSGRFISHDLEQTLSRNVEYLLSCGTGVHMDLIRKNLFRSRLLLTKPELLKQYVQRADRLGADRSSMFLESLMAVCIGSDEAWEKKLKAFRELGFSEDDIRRMFRAYPGAVAEPVEKVKMIKEVLLDSGKYTMESIVSCPEALSGSVEKRYKPRMSVLGLLGRKNLIKEWPSLSILCRVTDEKFFKRYADPHKKEISDVLPKEASQ